RTIYPFGTDSAVSIALPPLSKDLCGASRPGHFDGVASVVLRLVNIVTPHTLVLGDKDYQQRVLLERMLRDLHIPASVVSAEIYREPDGLAMSSRNSYLTADERAIAPGLYEILGTTAKALRDRKKDHSFLEAEAMERLTERGFKPEYVSVRRAGDLAPPDVFEAGDERVVLAAARLGKARLIDNMKV
ncbi:MAG: pantoate--beta-alanine ligase, partial [Gammaproteobacteria bacterium]